MPLPSSNEVTAAFADAIRIRLGNAPGRIIADGQRHRFSASGKAKDTAGWYVLHMDERPAGAFGSWRGDINERWVFGGDVQPLTDAEREQMARKQAVRRREEDFIRARLAVRAQEVAKLLWSLGNKIGVRSHPYVLRKQIDGFAEIEMAARVVWGERMAQIMRQAGFRNVCIDEMSSYLIVPMERLTDRGILLESAQWIDGEGKKRYLAGTQKKGLFCKIGGRLRELPDGATVDVVEGFATGISVAAARGNLTVCVFDAGNLLPVVEALLGFRGDLRVTIIADNDRKLAKERPDLGNVGVLKAEAVKEAFPSVEVLVPRFPPDAPVDLSDFNDLACYLGGEG